MDALTRMQEALASGNKLPLDNLTAKKSVQSAPRLQLDEAKPQMAIYTPDPRVSLITPKPKVSKETRLIVKSKPKPIYQLQNVPESITSRVKKWYQQPTPQESIATSVTASCCEEANPILDTETGNYWNTAICYNTQALRKHGMCQQQMSLDDMHKVFENEQKEQAQFSSYLIGNTIRLMARCYLHEICLQHQTRKERA